MTQEELDKLTMPKHLSEITEGLTRDEQLKVRCALVNKFGEAAWNRLCVLSARFPKK